jgi:hypothetical protein
LPAALLVMIRPHKAQIVLALAFLAPERFAGDAFFPFVWRDIEGESYLGQQPDSKICGFF